MSKNMEVKNKGYNTRYSDYPFGQSIMNSQHVWIDLVSIVTLKAE